MKPTSAISKTATKTRRRKAAEQPAAIQPVQEVLDCLRRNGARPMSAATRARLAAAGCLGMPEE